LPLDVRERQEHGEDHAVMGGRCERPTIGRFTR
jgi:hypothetical protein